MKFSDFKIGKHPHYGDGIKMRSELCNGNGLSIISGEGAYCDDDTYEIAPLKDGELFEVENWGDQVRGYVTPEEIDVIIDHMYKDTPEEYYEFLNNFEFKNRSQTLGELFNSILIGLKNG